MIQNWPPLQLLKIQVIFSSWFQKLYSNVFLEIDEIRIWNWSFHSWSLNHDLLTELDLGRTTGPLLSETHQIHSDVTVAVTL